MSLHQEKSKETVVSVPDVTIVSDDEDEVDLEAVARLVKVKLDQDLVDAKARNERIMWMKQEQADRLRKQKEEEDKDAKEAQRQLDEAAKAAKKIPVQPPVSPVCLLSWGWKLTWLPGWASGSA